MNNIQNHYYEQFEGYRAIKERAQHAFILAQMADANYDWESFLKGYLFATIREGNEPIQKIEKTK